MKLTVCTGNQKRHDFPKVATNFSLHSFSRGAPSIAAMPTKKTTSSGGVIRNWSSSSLRTMILGAVPTYFPSNHLYQPYRMGEYKKVPMTAYRPRVALSRS